MAVAFDAASQAEELSGDGVLSWTHTGTGSDLGVFVGIGNNAGTPRLSTSTTYGGTGLTEVWDAVFGTFWAHAGYHWPGGSTMPSGAQTITNTLAGTGDEHRAGAISMTGVHQTTPVGTAATATGISTTATVTVAAPASDSMVCASSTSGWTGATPGANETERYDEDSPAGTNTSGTTQSGADGGVMTHTRTAAGFADNWGIGAIEFLAAAGGAAVFIKMVGNNFRLAGSGGLAS